jgi:hypothetical protein
MHRALRRRPVRLLLALAAFAGGAAALHGQRLDLAIETVDHPLIAARDVFLRVDDLAGGRARLEVGTLRIGERRFEQVVLDCPGYRWRAQRLECPAGQASWRGAAQPLALSFVYAASSGSLELELRPEAGERWRASFRGGRQAALAVELRSARLARAAFWLPALAAIDLQGRVDGRARWSSDALAAEIVLSDGGFSAEGGMRAAEQLGGRIDIAAERDTAGWRWNAHAAWTTGDAYWAPWFLAGGGLDLRARGRVQDGVVRVEDGTVALAKVGELRLQGDVSLAQRRLLRAQFDADSLDLAAAGPLLIAPLLAQGAAPQLDFSGSVAGRGRYVDGRLRMIELELKEVALADAKGRYALAGVGGRLAWREDAETRGVVHVGGARFGKLPFGAFDIPWRALGERVEIARVEAPLFDGRLVLEGVTATRRDDGWKWEFAGALHPVSMERLSEALGLPRMSGKLSASLPRVHRDGATIGMDGGLVVQVFDGYLAVTGLELTEPFGSVPRLTATIDARHIDLGRLTETFSFGSITGYVDGHVRDMELVGWRPQRFDAAIESSPGDYERRISQRAVQNISALGGAGAAAAIQRSFLRVFETFGYGRLGLSCRLRGGVCEMGGIEEAPQGYVIVKGGGVPAITVKGYNRRVDWDELVARLKRVTESNAAPVVR